MIANDKVPDPILLAQTTSSGKSSVPQTDLATASGVTIIINRTKSLDSDPDSKKVIIIKWCFSS